MHYYDIYPPLVKGDYAYTLPQAKALVLEAVAPLGGDYVEAMRRGFASRWMDAFARPHKDSGAHMAGSAYDVHPYVLMSFTGNYDSVTTIAHEWGHAMHTVLANGQPFPTSRYAIFVAEIASTFNEALLQDRMLKTAQSDDERLFYLGTALEGLRATFFRQARQARRRRPRHARALPRAGRADEREHGRDGVDPREATLTRRSR
jgi:oligoendopeptidase F